PHLNMQHFPEPVQNFFFAYPPFQQCAAFFVGITCRRLAVFFARAAQVKLVEKLNCFVICALCAHDIFRKIIISVMPTGSTSSNQCAISSPPTSPFDNSWR